MATPPTPAEGREENMSALEQFIKENETSGIIKAEWTVNGKDPKNKGPHDWNYMRVKLRNGKEFLLHADEVQKIGPFAERWHDK
jgi:hypothetical protein